MGVSIAICISVSIGLCFAGYKIEKGAMDHYERAAQGCYSTVVLSVVYFQYFGIFVMFLLIVESNYFIFYVIASISLVIMACQTYKISFIFYLERNLAHPNLQAPGLQSPRGKFVTFTLLFLVANYLTSSVMIRYLSYSYYIAALSAFPLLNIVENSFRGIKKCYSKYPFLTQLCDDRNVVA